MEGEGREREGPRVELEANQAKAKRARKKKYGVLCISFLAQQNGGRVTPHTPLPSTALQKTGDVPHLTQPQPRTDSLNAKPLFQ